MNWNEVVSTKVRILALALGTSLPFLFNGCTTRQAASKPSIEFTVIPQAAEGAPDKTSPISGRVIGGRAGQRIVLFAKSGIWWVQPTVDKPFTAIQNYRRLSWLVASLVLLCLADTAAAIDPNRDLSQYIHDQWGSAKGFPGGQVYAITQTSDGYLWIGAEKGLVRFNGLNFHLFQHANTPVIPVGPIRSLVADNEGGLWIHFGEPRILRYANGNFEDVASLLPQSEPAFTAMGRGANGEVLISALVNGTLQYTNGKFVELVGPTDLPNFLVISLAKSADGKLWLGTRDLGLFYATHGDISNIGKSLSLIVHEGGLVNG